MARAGLQGLAAPRAAEVLAQAGQQRARAAQVQVVWVALPGAEAQEGPQAAAVQEGPQAAEAQAAGVALLALEAAEG